MKKLTIITFLLSLIGICSCTNQDSITTNFKSTRPNIVIIMADDLGFSDIGCYGGEINTPNIDSLAERGILYTQTYNAARCCPTRASLLTGLHPHRAGLGHLVVDRGIPGYRGQIGTNSRTLAEILKSSGYQTYMTGKWHLSRDWRDESNKDNWPCQRGFDKYYGFLVGHTSLWNPKYLVSDNSFIEAPANEDYLFPEAMTQASISYIKEASASDKPFFMYVAYPNPHYPLHAREKTIEKYNGVYDKGWDVIRKQRYENMKRRGIISDTCKLSPRDEMSPAWEDEKWPKWQAHRMQVYAAMVDEMDQGIGKIIQSLKDTKEYDNTLIFFLSDNGGSPEGHLFNTIERLNKPWATKMYPTHLPDGRKVNAGDWPDKPLGGPTTYGSYGVKWANLSNTPFRNHKHWNHEGGISTPMIVHWSRHFKESRISREICHIIDFMPTILALSGAAYPETHQGNSIDPLEGKSLLPTFNGKPIRSENDILCWEHEGHRAVRMGKWKLVLDYPGSWKTVRDYSDKGKWELYNMETDRSELSDLAAQHPDIVKKLSDHWQQWAKRNYVVDWKVFDQASMQKPD